MAKGKAYHEYTPEQRADLGRERIDALVGKCGELTFQVQWFLLMWGNLAHAANTKDVAQVEKVRDALAQDSRDIVKAAQAFNATAQRIIRAVSTEYIDSMKAGEL